MVKGQINFDLSESVAKVQNWSFLLSSVEGYFTPFLTGTIRYRYYQPTIFVK